MTDRIWAKVEPDWHDGETGENFVGGTWDAGYHKDGVEYIRADPAPAPVSVPEAAKLLLGDDINSPMLTALDPFNNDADVAQDVLAALRALSEGEG